ncbi:glycosyltransferase [Subtercola vilae]|uniref:Glycosyltransferase family 1 protein n=1 Tax=Subtercola vilae TaxID=2056433 RepID=A0A4T2C114_9MICO|nr:glycosyltransferase [Subtercola vilae]TIH37815.1 glycosyltransferase family 1 protein [Subtercola vilae]
MSFLLDAPAPEHALPSAERALRSRLMVVADELLADASEVRALAGRGSGVLLGALVHRVQASGLDRELWLLLVAMTAAFPNTELMLRTRRALGMAAGPQALSAVLDASYHSGTRLQSLELEMRLVTDKPVVDVDFCARFDHNTGIQRVVRETMSRWNGEHSIELACWADGDNCLRTLAPIERRRVLEWDSHKAEMAHHIKPDGRAPAGFVPELVVPYRTTVVLPEVAHDGLWPQLSALARFSGNQTAMIGYDTIPIASADLISSHETEKFSKYLTIVKNATRVVAISDAAAGEFRGFASALVSQGVGAPVVGCVTLAVQSPARGASVSAPTDQPEKLVLMVGNQEPRKNLLAVLFAAETLWREGLQFTLRMIGGGKSDYTRLIDHEAKRLAKAGHAIEVLRGAGDDVLIDSYRAARFTVFPSTHEGYGLPVAESLAMGVPSITSNYGSTQQIADGGGCLTVDPRNDQSIVDAMRLLLTDDVERERLAAEARARVPRTWNDYATELWHELVEPLENAS